MIAVECPNCKSTNVGKIGNNLYFCRDCNCEIKIKKCTAVVSMYDSEGCISKRFKVCYNA
ncbi:hypothetical protein TthWC1_1725a [Thermoanaerobacter thermohydrosulfuricus WC1]|uniref:Uncharacterized protein n=4 Tax=Thermoanaerobacter TaxID=1754 RepID=I9KRR2_9THEO|nr:hypothetical protein Thebr_0681 [Thermoanaerobacter brockii subsp. finnii Ako-1]AEM79197.1 hypothetical protein Thewi_1806 [Thermoanaerobacter wiegelii Rt8.B1]EIV99470.1 LOW QUALITY PROTEIN: hypothetical protein ThesiDRAFT1_0446 [Thermoanaerobacter siderophilus SR4]EMT38746.1 hypothetical protein TthWC1_1725a [Thermoanaerobacter thermohydrosulfuricus WC1]KHO62972.1 hypothetical protein THYS13_10670 [Thermoanaerobacter sp. YS13]